MTTFIIIILTAGAIIFFLSRKKTQPPANKNINTFLSQLPTMSDEDLNKMFMDLTTTLFLRDLAAEKFNDNYATNICKNLDYGCKNYSEVVTLYEAAHKEMKRRKL